MLQGLENAKKVKYFEYDFSKEAGAVGDITLRGGYLPEGAIVLDGKVHVQTALTSGGAATVALKLQSAADVLAATAIASLSLNAILDTVPDGTAANAVRLTAKRQLVATVATETLTAGKFVVAVEYIVTTE